MTNAPILMTLDLLSVGQVSFLDHALHPLFLPDVGEPMIGRRPLRQVSFLDHALHPLFLPDVGEPMIRYRPLRQVSYLDHALHSRVSQD